MVAEFPRSAVVSQEALSGLVFYSAILAHTGVLLCGDHKGKLIVQNLVSPPI